MARVDYFGPEGIRQVEVFRTVLTETTERGEHSVVYGPYFAKAPATRIMNEIKAKRRHGYRLSADHCVYVQKGIIEWEEVE